MNEDTFEALRDIAEERDLSLSAVFRDQVDTLVEHDGRVQVVPDRDDEDEEEFPPTVEVPTSFVREHGRLELEARHLREQHDESITRLREELGGAPDGDGVVHLDDLDAEPGRPHYDAGPGL